MKLRGLRGLNERTASFDAPMNSAVGVCFFCPGEARPQTQEIVRFIDDHRHDFGVEPICQHLQIAPSTYHRHKQLERQTDRRSQRVKRDEQMMPEILRVWEESHSNYGARKVWKQLRRESFDVARCTVERLMQVLDIQGVRLGAKCKTTTPDDKAHCLVIREFRAQRPNQLWVADITYIATWSGFVYVAFVIDVFSPRIVGWRAMKNMRTDLILDAFEQGCGREANPKA